MQQYHLEFFLFIVSVHEECISKIECLSWIGHIIMYETFIKLFIFTYVYQLTEEKQTNGSSLTGFFAF